MMPMQPNARGICVTYHATWIRQIPYLTTTSLATLKSLFNSIGLFNYNDFIWSCTISHIWNIFPLKHFQTYDNNNNNNNNNNLFLRSRPSQTPNWWMEPKLLAQIRYAFTSSKLALTHLCHVIYFLTIMKPNTKGLLVPP